MSDITDAQLTFYAKFAADVYNSGSGNDLLDLGTYIRPHEGTADAPNKGDFYGRLYRNSSGTSFIVAIRGTDNSGDYESDVNMALGGTLEDPEFASTVALIKQALKLAGWDGNPVDPNDPASVAKYDAARAKVTLVGHSLGGGLAAEAPVTLSS